MIRPVAARMSPEQREAVTTAVGTLGDHMGLFNKLLHAGEGRKLKLARVDRPRSQPPRARDGGAAPTRSSRA